MHEDIIIELAQLERRAFERVRHKIASQQLGEAWIDLPHSGNLQRLAEFAVTDDRSRP